MPRDITVTFDDGTSHVYTGAPDDVTPEAVQQRAQKEFGKTVRALDGGRRAQAQEPKVAPDSPAAEPAGLSPEWGGIDQPVAPEPPARSVLEQPARTDLSFAEASRGQREIDDRIAAGAPARQGTIRATTPEASLDRWSERAGRAVMDATANPRLAALARGATDTALLGPEALGTGLKLAADIANLGTLGLAQPVSDWLGATIQAVQAHKSDRFQGQQAEFQRLLADQNAGVLDVAAFMAANPRFSAEVAAPSVPSMLMGAAGARLGQILLKGNAGATTGAAAVNTLMNAGATFSDTNGDVGQKLAAAGAAGAGTALMGRLGGAEAALVTGRAAGARGLAGTALREAGQEAGESLSQSLGQGTAEGNFDLGQAAKQATVEGLAGGLMGGAAGAVAAPRGTTPDNSSPTKKWTMTGPDGRLYRGVVGPDDKIRWEPEGATGQPPAAPPRATIADITAATSVDEAIEAAASATQPPPKGGSLRDEVARMRARAATVEPAAPTIPDEALPAGDLVQPDPVARIEATLRDAGALPDLQQPPAEVAPAPSAQPTAAAPRIEGAKIDSEWTAFAPESGTKGVPRADMPQIKAGDRSALVQFLRARGIDYEADAEIEPSQLKPTQAEFSPEKVALAREFAGGERSILVSQDGHVLDGHHQWVQRLQDGQPVKAIVLKAPIDRLLAEVRAFPSATQAEGATAAAAADQAPVKQQPVVAPEVPATTPVETQAPIKNAPADDSAQQPQREEQDAVADIVSRASDDQIAAAAAALDIEASSAKSRRSMVEAQAKADPARVRAVLKEALQAEPAKPTRESLEGEVVTLRKRQSVLRSLLACMSQ